jgi:opacity protein-like surface antigen
MRSLALAAAAATLVLAPAQAAKAPAPSVSVPIQVGGGIAISVPKGWTACDAPTRALLGAKDASSGLAKTFCADFDGKGGAKAVLDAKLGNSLIVSMAFTTQANFPANFLSTATPEALRELSDKQCANTFGASAASCDFKVEKIAGHLVLDGIMSGTDPKGVRSLVQMVMLPVNGGSGILIFFGPRSPGDPRVKAILDSVTVSPTAP